jgi:hypothetical protein
MREAFFSSGEFIAGLFPQDVSELLTIGVVNPDVVAGGHFPRVRCISTWFGRSSCSFSAVGAIFVGAETAHQGQSLRVCHGFSPVDTTTSYHSGFEQFAGVV